MGCLPFWPAARLWDVVPGQIVVVQPRKQWRYAGNPCLSGEIESARLDPLIGLAPLKLEAIEMEQVLPGADLEDPFSDPIIESNDLKDGGDIEGAHKILMNLCQADLGALTFMHTLATLRSIIGPRLRFAITRWATVSAHCRSAKASMVSFPGDGSTTVYFSVA